jgi:hypothetical protein
MQVQSGLQLSLAHGNHPIVVYVDVQFSDSFCKDIRGLDNSAEFRDALVVRRSDVPRIEEGVSEETSSCTLNVPADVAGDRCFEFRCSLL